LTREHFRQHTLPCNRDSESSNSIIKSCLASTTPQVNDCAANDWTCMCNNQKAVVTCYNNCPSDPNAFGAKQQLTSWCNAAKA
jgi:hypothetical protein